MKRDSITGNSKNDIVKISGCNGQKISAKGASCNYFNDANLVDFFLVEPKKEEELIIVGLNALSFRLVFITGASQTNKRTFAWTDPETNPFIAKKNRLYSFDDRTGNLKIYIDNNVYTNDPRPFPTRKGKGFFVADVGILLKYILNHINKNAVIAAAKKTTKDVSEAEKTATQIAELKEAITDRDNAIHTMRSLFEGRCCPWDMRQTLLQIPKNVKDDFLAIEKTYSILFADRTLLRTELEKLKQSNERVTADLVSLIGPMSILQDAHKLPFFGLRWPGSKRSQIAAAIKEILSAFKLRG